ncbi:MAG TPA: hypothetical protein VFS06_15350 [Casimicrobiaceae bacterium]|nr:hypothetical protein [Casimicrobiaceae bacterium]
MSLEDWLRNDWLKRHTTTKAEIESLLAIVDRELQDSQVDGLSADGRFSHAYRAALSLATVLLYASGYSSSRGQSHHYRTIEAIPLILGARAKDDSVYLQSCRAKRNSAEYDAANEASESECAELIEFVKELRATVRRWLRKSSVGRPR